MLPKGNSNMSYEKKHDYLAATAKRYSTGGRRYKTLILNEFSRVWGCHRKHAIRLLNGIQPQSPGTRGTRSKYGPDVVHILEVIWLATNRLCSKLLKAALPTWMPHYRKAHRINPTVLRRSPKWTHPCSVKWSHPLRAGRGHFSFPSRVSESERREAGGGSRLRP